MTEHTAEKLARALEEIPGIPPNMITRARSRHYHEFLSPLPYPLVQLVRDLEAAAGAPATPPGSRPLLRVLIARVREGEFGPTKEESDKWAASPAGLALFAELIDGYRRHKEGGGE